MLNIFKVLIASLALINVSAHSNMHKPTPRGNLEWWGYCSRGNGCQTACDAPKSKSPFNSIYTQKTTVKRGDTLPVEWFRQNHPGGFVRIAMTPMENSDDPAAFDQNDVKYVCYETNCKEDFHEPILGEKNGPGSQLCSTSIVIPDNLPDGPVTLQWVWYGGGVLFADNRASFANYVSCSDMVVSGGNPYKANKPKAEFKGGDAANLGGDKCRYWSTNSVHGCPLGAEDKNKNGCGYGNARFGVPAEWPGGNGKSPAPEQPKPSNPVPSSPAPEQPKPSSPAPEKPVSPNPSPEQPKPSNPIIEKEFISKPKPNLKQTPSHKQCQKN